MKTDGKKRGKGGLQNDNTSQKTEEASSTGFESTEIITHACGRDFCYFSPRLLSLIII